MTHTGSMYDGGLRRRIALRSGGASMSETYDPIPAARMLAAAWRDRAQITELPNEIRPQIMAHGYAVQHQLIEQLRERPVGWKLGIASRNSMKKAGIDRPVAGRVLASRYYR